MKTIEERAKEYSDRHKSIENSYFFKGYNYYIAEKYDAEKFAYEAGAYDQKTIDDAELLKLKSAWEKQAQINHDGEANYQQGYHDAIEKACEWLGPHLAEVADLYDSNANLLLRLVKENFRIAMEKKL